MPNWFRQFARCFRWFFRRDGAVVAASPRVASEFARLEERLGYRFRDIEILRTALTHPSYKVRVPDATDYQRLEFLGDAVLSLVLSHTLYLSTQAGEGVLTDARSHLVRGRNLARIGEKLELGDFLRLTFHSADANSIRRARSVLEDSLEAVFGAVYLDGGLEAARGLAQRLFPEATGVGIAGAEVTRSPKTTLQEWVQKDGRPNRGTRIEYRLTEASGDGVRGRFTVEVRVDGVCRGRGVGANRRAADEAAATEALNVLKDRTKPGAMVEIR